MKFLFAEKYLPSALIALLFISCSSKESPKPAIPPSENTKSFEAMNTFMAIKSYGPNASAANDSAEKLVFKLESLLSTTKNSSHIYKLNHAEKYPVQVDDKVKELANFALKMAKETDGALNPVLYPIVHTWGFTTEKYRVPADSEIQAILPLTDFNQVNISSSGIAMKPGMMMDLGAVGKGYAGDKILELLKSKGITSAVLDLGGNVQTLGCKKDGKKWKVGITNPWGGPPIGGVEVCDMAVVTSGGYERFFEQNGKRYIHIFDGKNGKPVENGLSAVMIIAPSGLYADALSTAIFVMGENKAIDFWKKNREKFQMLLLREDKSVLYTKELDPIIRFTYSLKSKNIID
jgi:thiamine biosynthesis lipoprotein